MEINNVKKLIFISFGFKYGIPQEANFVLDVRFAPNPFYVPELKLLSGRDDLVRKYIRSFEEAESFLTSSIFFLDCVIPCYLTAYKETLYVAIGCTGGRHRSVAFVEWLSEHYKSALIDRHLDYEVEIHHRDIDMASGE